MKSIKATFFIFLFCTPLLFVNILGAESLALAGFSNQIRYRGAAQQGNRLFLTDSGSKDLLVFDTVRETLLLRKSIKDLTGYDFTPRDLAASKGKLFILSSNAVYVLDSTTLEKVGSRNKLALPGGQEFRFEGIAIDDTWIYLSCNDDTTLYRWPLKGGAVEAWAELPIHANPRAMSLGDEGVYVLDIFHDVIRVLSLTTGSELFSFQHVSKGGRDPVIYQSGYSDYVLLVQGTEVKLLDYDKGELKSYGVERLNPYMTRSNPRRVQVKFSESVSNNNPTQSIRSLTITAALPAKGPHQTIHSIAFFGGPYRLEKDRYGNPFVIFDLSQLPPGATSEVGFLVDATVYGLRYHFPSQTQIQFQDIPQDIRDLYLTDSLSILAMDSALIQKAAREVPGDRTKPVEFLRSVRDWVFARMEYARDGDWDNAAVCLDKGSGSCSEYSFITSAILRLNGYPTRYVGSSIAAGYDGPVQVDEVYHRWIEVYLAGYGWVPMDCNRNDTSSRDYWSNEFVFGVEQMTLIVLRGGGEDADYLGGAYIARRSWRWDGAKGSNDLLDWKRQFRWEIPWLTVQ